MQNYDKELSRFSRIKLQNQFNLEKNRGVYSKKHDLIIAWITHAPWVATANRGTRGFKRIDVIPQI